MPKSVYFDLFNNTPEQRLMDDLVNETVQIYGIDTYYMPRESETAIDLVMGDDPNKKFTSAYPVEVYVQSVDNFEGGEIFSKFGLEVRKQARFLITNRSFKKNVPTTLSRPREGDVLWMSNFRALFEIKYVDEEYFFYAMGTNTIMGYSLICEKFRYSNEVINTGVTALDDKVDEVVPAYAYQMFANSNSASYILSEKVYMGPNAAAATANATVVAFDLPTKVLTLKHIQGVFLPNNLIVGINSGARFTMNTSDQLFNVNDLIDNNSQLRNETNTWIDFTETNPFGEPR
jgi:hypothetical protein